MKEAVRRFLFCSSKKLHKKPVGSVKRTEMGNIPNAIY